MITSQIEGSCSILSRIVEFIVDNPKTKTCIDIMCGEGNVSRFIPYKEHRGYDIEAHWEQAWKDTPKPTQKYQVMDVRKTEFETVESADWITCLDGIEHISKEEGYRIMEVCLKKANEGVIFFTPDSFVTNEEMSKHPEDPMDPHTHKCVWKPEDLDDTWRKAFFPDWHGNPRRLEFGTFLYWKGGKTESEVKQWLGR